MSSESYNVRSQSALEATPGAETRVTLSPPAAPDALVTDSLSESERIERRNALLAGVWAARGIYLVPLAVLIGWIGEMSLLSSNDFATSTRNYVIAIALTILALAHPTWTFLRRVAGRSSADVKATREVNGPQLASEASPVGVAPARADATPHPSTPGDTLHVAAAVPFQTSSGSLPMHPARSGSQVVSREAPGNHNGSPPAAASMVPYEPAGSLVVRRKVKPPAPAQSDLATGAGAATESAGSQKALKLGAWERYRAFRAKLGWKMTAAGLGIVLILAIVAALQFSQNSGSVLGGWLWVASLLVMLLTFLGADGWPRGKGLLEGPWGDWFARGVPRIPFAIEAALVVVMMGVAVAMRVWNLEYHPGIFGDEGERGIDARGIFNGQPDNIFGTGWWGVPNFYFYTVATSFRVFGDNLIGDRMVSVMSGLVAVWFIYKTGRLLWGPRAGLIAGSMLAVSPLALQFSRLAGESSVTGALWAVGAFYLFLALRHRRWLDFALAGFFWSINLYYYPSGKLIIPLAGAVVLYALVRWRLDFFRKYALGFVMMGIAFLLTFMPYAIYSIQDHWQAFAGRAQETSIFSPQNQQPTFARYGMTYDPALASQPLVQSLETHPAAWAGLIYQQARESLDALYRRGDQVFYYREDRNNGIVLQPLWAVLGLLGLAYAAWKILDARFGLALIWFIVGLSGSFLTLDVPNLQRYTGAWPALMLFPAALLDRTFASGWPLNVGIARKWSAIPLVALCIYLAADAYQEYFVYYPTTCPYCTETVQARYVQALGQDYKGYQMGVGGYDIYFGYGSTRFVAKGVEGEDMLAAADDLPVTDNNGKGLAFIIYPNNADYLPLIRLFYPMGVAETMSGQNGQFVFTSIKVTRDQVASTRTLHATYKPAKGETVQRDEPGIGTSEERPLPEGLAYPVQAEWKGGLVAPQYGTYTLSLTGAGPDGKLKLDGRAILQQSGGGDPNQPLTVQVVLAQGIHDIRLTGTLASNASKLEVAWSGKGAGLSTIDPTFLSNGPTGGLSGEIGPLMPGAITRPDPFPGQQVRQRRSDPFIGFREASVKLGNSSYMARWRGQLDVPSEGDYAFSLAGSPQGLVIIDGKSAYGTGPNGPSTGGPVHLTSGLHDIEVRYAYSSGPARIELLWTPPGAQPAIIPPTALVPAQRSWTPDEIPTAPAGTVPPTESQAQLVKPDMVIGAGDLKQPRGIAVDKAGNVYVGDRGNHRVVVYGADGKLVRSWGEAAPQTQSGGSAPALKPGQFAQINDIAVGDDGLVYVFDDNQRVQVFAGDGQFKGSYEPAQLGLYGPNGIATGGKPTDKEGVGVYIAATGQNRIVRTPSLDAVRSGKANMPASLESITVDGTNGTDHLEQPVDVIVDPASSRAIYTIDLKDRILKLEPPARKEQPWTLARQWPVPVGRADGGSRLAISADGSKIYMTDPDKSRLDILDVARGAISFIGTAEDAPDQFGMPSGVAVGPDGRIYVSDSRSNSVQVFTLK